MYVKSKKQMLWIWLHYLTSGVLLLGVFGSISFFNEEMVTNIIRLSAQFGMIALAMMFAIKNIALAHASGHNKVADILRKQLPWQREQGLIAFNAFMLHIMCAIILFLFRKQLSIGIVMYMSFTAFIPTALMFYLYATSFRPIQKRVKGWKKSHSFGWILFGTVIAHEFILNTTLSVTTLIATIIAIGTLGYGIVVKGITKRSQKQALLAVFGFVLLGVVFILNNTVGQFIQKIGSNSNVETESKTSTTNESFPQTTEKSTSQYKDGTYNGTAVGYAPNLNVQVIIQGGKILSVEVQTNNETPEFLAKAKTVVTDEIVQKQVAKVTAVSGATRSSNGIMDAVEVALAQAI